MYPTPLRIGLLLSGLELLALQVAAQQAPQPGQPPSVSAAAVPQPVQVPPSPPELDDPTAILVIQPAPATRQLYAQQRVRSVLKVRLDDEGQVRDTVEYQKVDAQGRRTLLCHYGPNWQERRQWSYDTDGNCTSLVIHPVPGRAFTTIYTYNPDLGRGRCEVLQTNGRRTTVCELQRRQLGDTLLTEARLRALTAGRYHFAPSGYRRNWRFALGPDTLLTLVGRYSPRGRLQSTQLQYRLLQNGQPRETGVVDVRQAIRKYRRRTAAQLPAEQLPFRQLALLLRGTPGCFKATDLFYYDDRQRLAEQQQILPVTYLSPPTFAVHNPVTVRTSITSTRSHNYTPAGPPAVRALTVNTYNNLDQLIGQQRRLLDSRAANPQSYVVFSYQPDGLPAGETTNHRGQPVFYRYQYQYYE
jgi:hypothetical protein